MADRPDAVPAELEAVLNGSAPDARDAAWSALLARHTHLLINVARGVATEHDKAMDAYAYVLERLREDDYRRLRGFVADGRSAFSTWLVVVAQRLCVDHYRRRYGRAPRGSGERAAAQEERASRRRLLDLTAAAVDLESIVDDRELSPDAAIRAAELDCLLARGLAALPPADQLLLKLRFEDDLSAREAAEAIAMPSAFHVYRRLNGIFGRLRAWLEAHGVEGSAP